MTRQQAGGAGAHDLAPRPRGECACRLNRCDNGAVPVNGESVEQRIERLSTACRAALSRLDRLPIAAVFLYGSALGSGFRADSDVDVAVLDDAEGRLSWADQARLMDALERATKQGVDLRMLRDSSIAHQAHVLEEGLLVWPLEPLRAVDDYSRELLAVARSDRERMGRDWTALLARLSNGPVTRR